MHHVEAYFNQREHHETISQRRVYLATDDPSVLGDAKKRLAWVDVSHSLGGAPNVLHAYHYHSRFFYLLLLTVLDFLAGIFSDMFCVGVFGE